MLHREVFNSVNCVLTQPSSEFELLKCHKGKKKKVNQTHLNWFGVNKLQDIRWRWHANQLAPSCPTQKLPYMVETARLTSPDR